MTDEHDTDSTRWKILAFANQCGTEGRDAEDIARRRGWIDGRGRPTQEGTDLLDALDEQEATRSVFRTVP